MTYTELAPPDIEVSVETVTQTPTISTPTLAPVAVGPCYQIVEVTTSTGATNSSALVTLPAVIRSNIDQNYTIGGGPLTVTWKVNNGTTLTSSFPTGVYTAAQVVAVFNATTNLAGAVAETTDGLAAARFQLRTSSEGAFNSIAITGGTALTALGLPAVSTQTYTQYGYTQYDMTSLKVSPTNFYDAGRDNMDELTFDPDDIIVAYDDGSGVLSTVSDDSTIERWGTGAIRIVDDGDGDNYSNILQFPVACTPTGVYDMNSVAAVATVTAGAVFPQGGALTAGEFIEISVNGSQYHRVVFGTGDVLAAAEARINEVFPFTVASGVGSMVLTAGAAGSEGKGSESCILIKPGNLVGGTYTAERLGFTLGTAGGNQETTIGTWWALAVDDAVYADGVFMGYVIEIGVADGVVCEVKLDREWAETTFAGTHSFYTVSRNLTAAWLPTAAPTPDVYIGAAGDVVVKHRMLRTSGGAPSVQTFATPAAGTYHDNGTAYMYLGYTALRLDVSASAESASLLSFDTTTEIESEIGPISSANPLAQAAYLMKTAASGQTVYALGIDEVSTTYPYGTATAYSTATDFLESEEVYCIVPLTQDRTILSAIATHVDAMSATAVKKERVLFGTFAQPTRAPDTIVSSGTEGNTTGVANEFNTGIPSLSALLLAAGIDPSAIVVADDVFLDIESDALNYNITGAVVGPIVDVNVTFGAGENLDSFYTAGALATPLINESWSLKIRGAELVTGTGAPDKTAIAQALSDIGNGFANDRVILGQPGTCTLSSGGIVASAPSFYAAAVEAGKTCAMPPQQGFTNTSTTGILSVVGATDYFSETQLNIAAGGGIWWWFQRTPAAAVTVRHQLTTDTTTIYTREYSVIKTLDFIAKLIRANYRPLLGRYNISNDLLSLMSAIMGGIQRYLVEDLKAVNEFEFENFEVDSANPDTLYVNVNVGLQLPFNKLRVRIRI